jgi:hypothetical protein
MGGLRELDSSDRADVTGSTRGRLRLYSGYEDGRLRSG